MANLDATPSIDCYRLIVLFFEATPDINQIEAAVDTLPEPSAVHFAQCDAHASERPCGHATPPIACLLGA